jgi:3-oxoacyl-[acyl-carrier-protein] synthase-1
MAVGLYDLGIICSLGNNKQAVLEKLTQDDLDAKSCLSEYPQKGINGEVFYVGAVKDTLPTIEQAHFATRNNQLLQHAFSQVEQAFLSVSEHVDKTRIAVVIGTSTSAIEEGEQAYKHFAQQGEFPAHFDYAQQEMYAPAEYLAYLANAKGPAFSISTACSSSGKALASAMNLINSGIADIVLCGGVDSLCQMTLNGFSALESTASTYCTPFNEHRDGINIGEAAALFVVTKAAAKVNLLGAGESSDAYHVSAPEPSGRGAIASMQQALAQAGLTASDIDYINAHGTATPKNDEMEASAIHQLGFTAPVSSTKALTGHTLGAAGALEAGICWLLLSDLNKNNKLPQNHPSAKLDPALCKVNLVEKGAITTINTCLSNSFAFGGNNLTLVLGK